MASTDTTTDDPTRIAMILSSHEALGDTGETTGWYLSEAAHPWKVFTEAGIEMVWVSPEGGFAPMDGRDLDDEVNVAFLDHFGDKGPETVTPSDVAADEIDAVFYVGGHGTMWDFPDDPRLASLAAAVHGDDGVVAAVCHGPAGLLNIETGDGSKLIAGKQVAGFTNSEEESQGLTDVVPFLLADALSAAGAEHRPGPDFEPQVVVDGRLVTGQNPPSATGVAEAVVDLLSSEDD